MVCHFFFESARHYPVYVFSAVAIWMVAALVRGPIHKTTDRKRGWRVGHVGRDTMYYEEFRERAWQRMEIDGEMLIGKAHHVIYFASLQFPEWASERRDEIVGRIKSKFHPPEYEYDDG
jgi:hypothetical protein